MMELGSPLALLLLLPVLALPLQGWITGRSRLAAIQVMERRTLTARLILAWVPDALMVVGLLLCVFALARPRITHRDTMVESDGLDILLALDTSGSMQATDFSLHGQEVNRLQVAKGVMEEFIQQRPNDRIGVVVFGEEAFTHVPLTLDHDTLINVLDHVEIGVAGPSATAIGSAIAVSARRLKQIDAPERIVILLTDGQSNAGDVPPATAAQMAAALGIKVYTVGIGARARRMPFGLSGGDGLDEKTLTEIAEITGARFFRATTTRDLRKVYATIDELETSPAEVRELVRHEELFRYFLVPGLLSLMASLALAATWLRRGP